MKKRILWRQMAIGLTAMMCAVPVFAEEAPEAAVLAKHVANGAQEAEAPAVAEQAANAAEEAVSVEDAKKKAKASLAPYIGKTITKQLVTGNTTVPEAEIMAALKSKPGMEFTEAGLTEDLNAIYALGWFYDLRPEFTLVPEGVQVTYHVLENPVYKGVDIEGNTVIKKDKAAGMFDLEEGTQGL